MCFALAQPKTKPALEEGWFLVSCGVVLRARHKSKYKPFSVGLVIMPNCGIPIHCFYDRVAIHADKLIPYLKILSSLKIDGRNSLCNMGSMANAYHMPHTKNIRPLNCQGSFTVDTNISLCVADMRS
jgi:hypothetical protein